MTIANNSCIDLHIKPTDDSIEEYSIDPDDESRKMHHEHKKLSQEELDYLANKYNNTTKFEESKIRHKKTPAISIKNNNFLETIKGFNYSSRNDNSKKIKYPKHESSQNSNMVGSNLIYLILKGLQSTGTIDQLSNTPMNHQETSQSRGIPSGVLRTDLRREDPLQGFANSNKGSSGSGGIPNTHSHMSEIDKDMVVRKAMF